MFQLRSRSHVSPHPSPPPPPSPLPSIKDNPAIYLDSLSEAEAVCDRCDLRGLVEAMLVLNGGCRPNLTPGMAARARRTTLFDLHNKLLAVYGFHGRKADDVRPFSFSYGRVFQW